MIEYPLPALSPEEFELLVKGMLDAGSGGLVGYRSRHRESIVGSDGEYEFDVTVRFSAIGADYLTLVECKYYKNRVNRERVQALWAKVQSVGAHKGIIFATAGFQSGAIEFAKSHGIALVAVADGRSSYLVKGKISDSDMIPWEIVPDYIPRVVAWVIDGDKMSCVGDNSGRRLRDLVPDLVGPPPSAPSTNPGN
jgi:restriction system protein